MVPLIGQDEEVEAASFMPRAFRSTGDTVMRKWQAGDLMTTALDGEIGGGTFGEQGSCVFILVARAPRSKVDLRHSLNTPLNGFRCQRSYDRAKPFSRKEAVRVADFRPMSRTGTERLFSISA